MAVEVQDSEGGTDGITEKAASFISPCSIKQKESNEKLSKSRTTMRVFKEFVRPHTEE
jgi:hypothetical protein